MKYSQIEQARKTLCEFVGNVRQWLYNPETNIPFPSEKTFKDVLKQVCDCLNEKDYIIPDRLLNSIKTLYLGDNICVTDYKNEQIPDVNALFAEHYNPKMMAKTIDTAEDIVLIIKDKDGEIIKIKAEKQYIKNLLQL